MRKRLLRVYSFITNYRYRKIVKLALARGDQPGPEKEPAETNALLPRYYQGLKTEVIVQKATASLTSVSALLAFTVALVPLIVWKQFDNLFTISEYSRHMVVFWTAVAFLLPYLTFWIERHISVANVEEDKKVRRKNRYWRSWALVFSLVLSVCICWNAMVAGHAERYILAIIFVGRYGNDFALGGLSSVRVGIL
jgi:hypothetical protein